MKTVKVIGFDADDTLWINEPYFRDSEDEFCSLISEYVTKKDAERRLLEVERNNMTTLGYGTKAFIISMIETAMEVSDKQVTIDTVERIINIGKNQLMKPVKLVPGIRPVLNYLKEKYRLVLITKGDLLEQEIKIRLSGLEDFFESTEIVSAKKPEAYHKILTKLDVLPSEFLMVGNSLKSDILPVLDLGGYTIHIPSDVTWVYELVSEPVESERCLHLKAIKELINVL